MKNQHLIDNLSTSEKADLFQHLYAELAGQGTDGDTELAHVNRFEAQVLRNIGGSGTVNKVTGFRQYGKGGSPPAQPDTTTTKNVPEYAPEQREYIRDIFGKSQELYEQRMEEGYEGGPDARMAGLDPRETEAFTGISNLARGPGPARAYEIARQASLGSAAPITAGEIQQGMNPYQQAVTDIGKREAVRDYQRGPQAQLRSGAVESGGLRGARRFIEEGEGQRNLNQQLADLQTMGSQQAFQQSMAEAAAARGRLSNLATQMPGIGQGAYDQRMRQYGQLGGVGEAYRGREQAGINLAQQKFLQEQAFPEEQLGRYLRFITNAPSPSGFSQTVQAPGVRGPSALTQATGLMGGLGALAGGFGGRSGFNQGGRVDTRRGGVPTGRQAGLSGVVRRAGGGQIVRMQEGGPPSIDFRSSSRKTPLARLTDSLQLDQVGGSGAKLLQNLLDFKGLGETRIDDMQRSFNTAPGVPPISEQGDFLNPNAGLPSGYDPMMELVAGLPADETPQVKETIVTEETAPEQKTISFKQIEAAAAAPQETKSAFMSGLDDLSTGDLLKMAGAFFTAGGQGSTGSMTNDALNFLGSAGVTAGDVMSKAQKRKLNAAEKAELLSLKKREVAAKETAAKAAVITSKNKNLPVFKAPNANDVAYVKTNLENGPYEKVSDAAVSYIAAMQKAYPKATIEQVAALLEANGSLVKDNTGFFSFIGGGTPTLQRVGE